MFCRSRDSPLRGYTRKAMLPLWKFPTYALCKRAATVSRPLRIAFALALTATSCRKAGPRGRTGILACHSSCGKEELPGRFAVRGMDNDLAILADAPAFAAYSVYIFQRQMNDTPLSRRHGVKPA